MSQEIQLYSKLQPADVITVGMTLGKSGCFGFDKAEQGVTALIVCMCDNISLATFMRTYHVMPGGKFSKKAMAAYAEFRAKGGKVKWLQTGDETQSSVDLQKAVAEFEFEGNKITYSYSIADAKKEGVYKKDSRYEKRPGQMLRARVITNALGMIAPEIFAGEDEGDYVEPAVLDLKPAATVEVKSEVTAHPLKESEAELAEVVPAKEWPAFEAQEKDGKLTKETTDEICKRVSGRNVAAVLEWLTKSSWTSGDLDTLSLARAKKIIANPESFLKHAKIGQPTK